MNQSKFHLSLVRWSSTWSSRCFRVAVIVVWFVFIETLFLSKKIFSIQTHRGRCSQMPRDTKNPITPLLFFLDYYLPGHKQSKSPLNAWKSCFLKNSGYIPFRFNRNYSQIYFLTCEDSRSIFVVCIFLKYFMVFVRVFWHSLLLNERIRSRETENEILK